MMKKKKLLFVINQFFKGGAETALLNLFRTLSPERYEVDFLVFDQINLKGTISLLPYIPSWVHTINVAEREGNAAFLKKAAFRLYRDATHKQLFRKAATEYLRDKWYDAAFSFGEWHSCKLVAVWAHAKRKYVWVHADMEKASFVHPDIIIYQQYFDRFLFASWQSMQGAVERWPCLKGRGMVVSNVVNREAILQLSVEPCPVIFPEEEIPVLLTVANVREEKNHLRQVRVMEQLFRTGKRFYWLNLGTLANHELVTRIQTAVREAGLEQFFLLPGAVENPYPIMKRADAVCVLSDHESWSMVITEAKSLGVPVIATKTSGALEQLEHLKTGLLCDFQEEDIAEKIGTFLDHSEYRQMIRSNLRNFSAGTDTLKQLEPLLLESRRKIAYLFDNVNYLSGARNAALAQMEFLDSQVQVDLFSIEPCTDFTLLDRFRTLDLGGHQGLRCLSMPCGDVLRSNAYSWKQKCARVLHAVTARLGMEQMIPQLMLKRDLPPLLDGYDAVCVVSEASKLRGAVSRLEKSKKIQWIHTDYDSWRNLSAWTRAVTRGDRKIYAKFDTIVCLSEHLKERFLQNYPHLSEKVVVIPNFIQFERIQRLAQEPPTTAVGLGIINLITIGRMEREKRYDLILRAAADLKIHGVAFHWYLVGDGPLMEYLQAECKRLELEEHVTFTGTLNNPYPLMRQCSVLVLLSDYEGTPVTVDESKVLGLPVLARDVGGVREQLEDGIWGCVMDGTMEFSETVVELLKHGSCSLEQSKVKSYNLSIDNRLMHIFGEKGLQG